MNLVIEVLLWGAVVAYLAALASMAVLFFILVAVLTNWAVWAMNLLWLVMT